ncbi:MAG: hypothetical protein HLX51_06755 [Micrococcaceae bacterium]|nr:hypothetical protein [Micrococcaceae bacterium]
MLYLITFDDELYYTSLTVGEFLVHRQDGESLDLMTFFPVEDPIKPDDVLQVALRNGFEHPAGLLVDASLVDIMNKPRHLEQASASQLALEAQLDELESGPTSVEDASFEREQDQIARDARMDHSEALNWANTARRDLLERTIQEQLRKHWDTHGV